MQYVIISRVTMKSSLYAVLIPVVVLLSTFIPAVGAVVDWVARGKQHAINIYFGGNWYEGI